MENVTLGAETNHNGSYYSIDPYLRAKYSYNNAVSILNNIAQNYLNIDLADRARCVGSDPSNPLNEGEVWYYARGSDNNYKTDFDQLNVISSRSFSDGGYQYYWVASRGCERDSYGCAINSPYGVRRVSKAGTLSDSFHGGTLGNLVVTNEVDYENMDEYERERYEFYYYTNSAGFRPIIRLRNDIIIVSGTGTINDPYIIEPSR